MYDTSDFDKVSRVKVKGLKYPEDFAVSQHYNCLYIGDNLESTKQESTDLGLVHRVDMSDRSANNVTLN